MATSPITVLAPAASGWTLLYVVSKVQYALDDRLGVAGGPDVPVSHYAAYGPGEVATAQWANAGVGLLMAAVLLLAVRYPAGWSRWVLTVPMAALFVLVAIGAAVMIVRDAAEGVGGTVFGLYCVIWAALVGATTWSHHRNGTRGRAAAAP